jgi:nitrite reductase/ring-hydroxylating ferredoxin subunit
MAFDLTGDEKAAQRLVGLGLLSVAPTAAAGLADWSELGSARRPKRVGLVHAASNSVTAALYAASWLARSRGDHARGRQLSVLGALTMAVGGYLGGHLSYSEGVGVNRNADEPKVPLDWTDAAAAADVLEAAPLRVDVDGQQVVLVRRAGTSSRWARSAATSAAAGGRRDRLSSGGEACLVCPWHRSEFRLATGAWRAARPPRRRRRTTCARSASGCRCACGPERAPVTG